MGRRVSQLDAITTIDNADLLYGVDIDDLTHSPEGTSKKFTKANLLKEVIQGVSDNAGDISDIQTDVTDIYSAIEQGYTGWNPLGQVLTYVSVDDPTGVVKVVGVNVTDKLSVGMRLMFTNGGNVIKAIITAISFSSDTTITFLHEIDPTDSQALALMGDSAITLPYYSSQKAPYGFPLSPAKWSIKYDIPTSGSGNFKDGSAIGQLGSLQTEIPVGAWLLKFKLTPYLTTTSSSYRFTAMSCNIGISTSTGSFSSEYLKASANIKFNEITGTVRPIYSVLVFSEEEIELATKTMYYVIGQAYGDTDAYVRLFGNLGSVGWIKAICRYL